MVRTRAVVVAILAAASLGGWWLGRADRGVSSTTAVVTKAIDGDPVEVRIGARTDTIRLLGVDTPETHHPTKPVQCYGRAASAFNERLVGGRRVRLTPGEEPRDRYGRRLAYVLVDGRRFNDELLALGYARLLVIEPNRAHAREMLREELAARRERAGLWGVC